MKILMVQDKPCVRNMKYAQAMLERGHNVDCAYTTGHVTLLKNAEGTWSIHNVDAEIQEFPSKAHAIANHVLIHKGRYGDAFENAYFAFHRDDLRLIIQRGGYDLIHSHNFPDTDTVKSLSHGVPVIYDAHDYYPWHKGDIKTLQVVATQQSDGRIFVTPYQATFAKQVCEYDEAFSTVFPNYTSRKVVPEKGMEKLSDSDGNVHLVYEGGASDFQHRDFKAIFTTLTDYGYHVHCYLTANTGKYRDYFSGNPLMHIHDALPLNELMVAMTQYDAGIMYFNLTEENKHHLFACAPNKMYEYWACGLPVITNKEIGTMSDQVRKTGWGIACELEEVIGLLPGLIAAVASNKIQPEAICVEDNIFMIERFYELIVKKYTEGKKALAESDKRVLDEINQKYAVSVEVSKHGKSNSPNDN